MTGDIIYDQTFNESFHQRIESTQYNAATTGVIRATSSEKLYQELGLRVNKIQMTLRQETLLILQNIYLANKSTYLYNLIRHRVKFYSTRSSQIGNISKSNFFRNYFFPSTIPELVTECNNVFKLPLFKFVRLVVKLEMYVFCAYKQCTNYTKCIQMLIKSYMLLMM